MFSAVRMRFCVYFCFAAMSYAAFLRAASDRDDPQERKPAKSQHVNEGMSLDGKIELGERIVACLTCEIGSEKTAELLEHFAKKGAGSQPSSVELTADEVPVDLIEDDDGKRVPYGFWKRFMRDELKLQCTNRKKMQLIRALEMFASRQHQGSQTRTAFRGMRRGCSQRSSGAAENSTKAVGLGWALLQFFVDVVQRLQCRTDSLMLMNKARALRAELLHDESGRWSESELPKLVGNPGHQWFWRWRQKYGISKQVIGMKLKVAWRKVKRRVLVLLTNIFRLRAWWAICHPNKTMRWLSVDQKPS
jgi:hypothetical protein